MIFLLGFGKEVDGLIVGVIGGGLLIYELFAWMSAIYLYPKSDTGKDYISRGYPKLIDYIKRGVR